MRSRSRSKKARNLCILLLLLILLTGCLVVAVRITLSKDQEPPVFTCDQEALFLTDDDLSAIEEGDDSSLLQGLHAQDDVDGDLTSKIVVFDYDEQMNHTFAFVQYKVMDSAGNISTMERLVYEKSMQQIYKMMKKSLG